LERTFIIVKPDAVQRGLTGEIIKRFEQRGLKIVGMKFLHPTRALVEKHYAEHVGKGFYEDLVGYLTSSPVVAVALEGPNAIQIARNTIGKTKPVEAEAGTIRGDFGLEIGRNLVHGSDKPESAARELALWFSDAELVSWGRNNDPWIYEKA
jgi:nucleoside-diphosphate kinase